MRRSFISLCYYITSNLKHPLCLLKAYNSPFVTRHSSLKIILSNKKTPFAHKETKRALSSRGTTLIPSYFEDSRSAVTGTIRPNLLTSVFNSEAPGRPSSQRPFCYPKTKSLRKPLSRWVSFSVAAILRILLPFNAFIHSSDK